MTASYDLVAAVLDNRGTLLLTLTVFFVSWFVMRKYQYRNRKLPPGLPSIPIIGSLPWLPSNATVLTFTEFSKKYGKVYAIDMGGRRNVILNDYGSIHEALVKKALIFADRPYYYSTQFSNPEQKGFVHAHFDDTFIRNKQASLAILRDLGLGRNVMEGRILSEVTELLEEFAKHEAAPFDPAEILYTSVSNIIFSVLFNKRFNYDDDRFCHAVNAIRDMIKEFGDIVILEIVPLIRYLPWARRAIKSGVQKHDEVVKFIEEELREQSEMSDPEDHERDFLAAYKYKMGDDLDPESLKFIVLDCFSAGTDTTSSTLLWALTYMANNPDIQSRVHEEIEEVVGQSRSPSMSDRTSMRYTEAVMLEVLRKSSIAAMALPHRVMADTDIQGFYLEKGTMVQINIWAVHHDPDVWPDPDRFDPERFLDDRGQVTGRERIIPFSLGRRSCLGEALARQELFLYFTSILQRFQVLPPAGEDKMPEEIVHGMVLTPKPHKMVLKPR